MSIELSFRASALLLLALSLISESAMAVNIDELWDFQNPELSEQRFRAALVDADPDSALLLKTQIARSYSLRQEYEVARNILAEFERESAGASAEVRVRYHLELGRTYVSAAHPPESISDAGKQVARKSFQHAYEYADAAQLDALAIDALHMMAFVDTDPEAQLGWARKALAVADASDQPAAKRWKASLLNNAGHALHQLQRYEEALAEFRAAAVLREQGSNAWATHVAHWMVAWTLRALERTDEAIDIQLRLAAERKAAGEPDPFVFEELEKLYRAKGSEERASFYAAQAAALSAPKP